MSTAAVCHDPVHTALMHAPIGALIIDKEGVVLWANAMSMGLFGEADSASLRHAMIYVWLAEKDAETLRQMVEIHFRTPNETRIGWSRRFDLLSSEGAVHEGELTLAPAAEDAKDQAMLFVRSLKRIIMAERRFAKIFETLPIGILIVDGRQRIVKVNRTLASEFGYAREELIGKPLDVLLPTRYRESHSSEVANYTREPSSRMMGSGRDLTGLHRSGQEFPIEIALTRHENASQPLYMAIVSNISYRKRAEITTQQTNAQLEEFTYVASHDLRSPLRGIADLVSWIREDIDETTLSAEVLHNFDRIAVRIQRAEQMIDDLLDYARVGVRDPHMELIEPRTLVEDALSLCSIPDGFRIELEIEAGELRAPPAPLATSLRNLISNAVKHHGGEHGTISIRVVEDGRFTVFTVEDDGQGIPEGTQERIFKLFHRGATKAEGDGVGLAFTRRMINAHGGMINVTSPSPLGGARFDIYWPRILLKEFDDD